MFKDVLRLIRPKQWVKNVFVFAAFIFTRGWADWSHVRETILAFVAMCLVSSATYVANDVFDVEKDRQHPMKKNRPIASGRIPVPMAIALSCGLIVASLIAGYLANPNTLYCLGTYILVQVLYNLGLRNKSVVDVGCIAAGFVIRVIIGAVAISSGVSGWILLCTATLSLMLGFGKRRHEFILQGANKESSRKSLAEYSRTALDMLVAMSATCAAMTYSVYSIESPTARIYPALILTTPWVIYGICRYLVLVFGEGETGEPENLVLADKHLIAVFVGYLVCAILALNRVALPFLIQ